MKYFILIVLAITIFLSCKAEGKKDFVVVAGKNFAINGKPYYYIGTNLWYGSILASTGEGGNRSRLVKELDLLQKTGVNNLRILVGAEGPANEPFRVTPVLQTSPGVYNDTLLDGLDFLMAEMKKRHQYAILYLNNSWDWTGGYAQYLSWNGYGKIPYPNVKPNTWQQFMSFAGQFYACYHCQAQFNQYIRVILERTNRYTGVKYTDDPTVMTWEIGNEPRAFGKDNIPLFEKWIKETAAYIKSLDKNHLVTTGTEGLHGCEDSMLLFTRIHADANIDYLTMHIWPKNWSWLDPKNISGTIDLSIKNTLQYMNDHMVVARQLNKPLVLEEFGLPRDFHGYSPSEKTVNRDLYYQNVFEQVLQNANRKGVLAGCNFWAFAGYGRPDHIFWSRGDAYLGDPPQEEQGLNAVFDTDSTLKLIAKYNADITSALFSGQEAGFNGPADANATIETSNLLRNLKKVTSKGIMFGHQDDLAYGVTWSYLEGRSDVKDVCTDFPAVYGWELGHLELGVRKSLDSVPFDKIREYIRLVHTRGGVNELSWHLDNPLTGGSAWDVTSGKVVSSILPGGAKSDLFKQRLDRLATFFLTLKDDRGVLIPVIFRPFHEHTGSWFWWGQKLCTKEEYIHLWQFTTDYLMNTKGVHNLLYAYSASSGEFDDQKKYLERYPGDNYVDIMGFDVYQANSNSSKFVRTTRHKLNVICTVASEKNKLPALTEAGYERIPDPKWWTGVLWPILKDYPVSYVLLWRNANNKPNHFYAPYPGHPSAKDFIDFYDIPQTLFQKDVTSEDVYRKE
jgi:mannan endo-1,4-beta-mannosidase